jgi:ribosomal protein S18 acetylase RimI-like enzyme
MNLGPDQWESWATSGHPGIEQGMISIKTVVSAAELGLVVELFQEYADSLDFDLGFQDFAREVAGLPGAYAPPDGSLFLAFMDGQVAGCVALRKLEGRICEMKRLYVRPSCRGRGLGELLIREIVEQGRAMGYVRMRLDTAPSMQTAQGIYTRFGFRDIEPYCHNPLPGARFMEMEL